MKKITFLMTGLLVLMLACDNPVNVPEDAPDVFRELVDEGIRVAAGDVNAHVYGSFSITFNGQPNVLTGEANFPGNPKNAGRCDNGLWYNPKDKPTSGSFDKPHPHCVGTGSESITVILEPISVIWDDEEDGYLHFTNKKNDSDVRIIGNGKHTRGRGTLEAYAIDAATLGTTKSRVGKLTFDLDQYDDDDINYFAEECDVDESDYTYCLNKVIVASYSPDIPVSEGEGVGVATENVTGFLYWKDASTPFNYGDPDDE